MHRSAAVLFLLAACAGQRPQEPGGEAPIAIVGVEIVSMLDDRVQSGCTVLIDAGIIEKIGPVAEVDVPQRAVRIDGAGRYLIPGLADMHVHLPEAPSPELDRILDLSLAHGVTLIRGMQGSPQQLAMREEIRRGRLAPALVIAGPPVASALTPEEARARVREQKSAGYDAMKILGGIDLAAYQAITAEARELRLPVCGHVPQEIGIEAALAARQASIEHGMGYDSAASDPALLDDLAQRTRDAGVWNCPTLDFFANATGPEAASRLEVRRKIVAALGRAGAPLLAGSDTPGESRAPGFAYLEELKQLAKAGLTPYQVLQAATRSASEFLGDARSGVIAEGMRADLVMLEKNPLESVENVARPLGVMVRGRWLSKSELNRLLARHPVSN